MRPEKPNILLLALAVVPWVIAGVLISWTINRSAALDRLSLSMTTLHPGAEIHMDGVISPSPKIISPLTKTVCVAFIFETFYVTEYHEGKTRMEDFAQLISQRAGPDFIPISTPSGPLLLPLAQWKTGSIQSFFWPGTLEEIENIPNHISIPSQDVQKAAKSTKGEFKHFEFHEWVLTENMSVFVAATLSSTRDPSGAWVLNPDPFHERNLATDGVYVYPGTREAFLKTIQQQNTGDILGIGLLILLGMILFGTFFIRLYRYHRQDIRQ